MLGCPGGNIFVYLGSQVNKSNDVKQENKKCQYYEMPKHLKYKLLAYTRKIKLYETARMVVKPKKMLLTTLLSSKGIFLGKYLDTSRIKENSS